MDIEQFRDLCLSFEHTKEEFPFDEHTLTFKVYSKIFAFATLEKSPILINLKCDPELALELRERYHYVMPGYHMNKKHWNTVILEEASEQFISQWTKHSYDQAVNKVPKSKRI